MLDEKLVFLVSLKSRSSSHDWFSVVANLRNTLRSIEASVDRRFEVVIAGHDDPREIDPELPAYEFLKATYSPPTDPKRGGHDKYRKRRICGAWLRSRIKKSVRVMFLDADDLVHRNLVSTVLEHPKLVAFNLEEGYRLDVGLRELEHKKDHFYMLCGSSFVIPFKRDDLPSKPSDKTAFFSRFTRHQLSKDLAAGHGIEVCTLGYPGVVYLINHSDSLERQLGKKKRIGEDRSLPWETASAIVKEQFALDLTDGPGEIE